MAEQSGRRAAERPFVFGDCLASKNELNPDMLAAWDEMAAARHCTRRKVVANLPYVIATPLISNLLISDIADRADGRDGAVGDRGADAGGRSARRITTRSRVLVQSVADVEVVRKVLPTNFYPRPKVDSAIVKIKPNAEKRAKVGDVPKFRSFLRDSVRSPAEEPAASARSAGPAGGATRMEVDAKLAEFGIDGTIRSESVGCRTAHSPGERVRVGIVPFVSCRVGQARLCGRRPTEPSGSDCGTGGSSLEDSLDPPYFLSNASEDDMGTRINALFDHALPDYRDRADILTRLRRDNSDRVSRS